MKNKNIITKTQKEVADTVIFPSSLDGQIKVSGGESGVVVKPITKAIPVELPVKPEIAEIKALIKEAREGLEWFQQDWINKSTLGDGINWATRLIYKLKRYE